MSDEVEGHDALFSVWLSSGMGTRMRPGETLSRVSPEMRRKIVAAVNGKSQPAPWMLKAVISTGG